MPSTIVPIEQTRGFSVRPAQGLRYGNFEGVNFLPPLIPSTKIGLHSIATLNNQQIYRTVCDWCQSWRPWQQRMLLCGIASRCSNRQLDILATTLEPLRHRDYATASQKQYPFASIKKAKPAALSRASRNLTSWSSAALGSGELMMDSKKSPAITITPAKAPQILRLQKEDAMLEKMASRTRKQDLGRNEKEKTEVQKSPAVKKEIVIDKFADKLSLNVLESAVQDAAIFGKVIKGSENLDIGTGSTADTKAEPAKLDKISEDPSPAEDAPGCKSPESVVSVADKQQEPAAASASLATDLHILLGNVNLSKDEGLTPPVSARLSRRRSSQLSESFLLRFRQDLQELREQRRQQPVKKKPRFELPEEQSSSSSPAKSVAQLADAEDIPREEIPRSRQLSRQSATFLGGVLEFSSPEQRRLPSRQTSGSTLFRQRVFSSSSAASTMDFFDQDGINQKGPMLREVRRGPVRTPPGVEDIPLPLQRSFKSAKLWGGQLPEGRRLVRAQRQELFGNFRQQLASVWKWLSAWEDFEKIALLKEVIKHCSPQVLSSLVSHIHQRLRDSRDINCLPDKLLLLIFSYLSPSGILTASQVCRRWRYLSVNDELWMLKCLELGESEGISNMADLILEAQATQDVDWQMAYRELRSIIGVMRATLTRPQEIFIESLSPDRPRMVKEDIYNMDSPPFARSAGKLHFPSHLAKIHLEDEIMKRNLVRRDGDEGSDVDSDESEDLSPILGEYALAPPETVSVTRSPGRRRRRPYRSPMKSRGESQRTMTSYSVFSEEEKTDRDTMSMKDLLTMKAAQKTDSDEEDQALDILPKLEQAKDILGKTVASKSLEWKRDSDSSDGRRRMYAGKVKTVSKVRKLQGHMNGIVCVQFDKRRLVTAGLDRTVRVWDVRSGRSLHKFYGHKGGIRCMLFDDEILVTGSWDMVLLVWSMKEFSEVARLSGHMDCVSCVDFDKDFIVSGSHDRTIRVWSRRTKICQHVIGGHEEAVTCLQIDGPYVLSGSEDRTIRMHDVRSGEAMYAFEPAQHPLVSLVLQESLLIAGDSQGNVVFWNAETGECEAAIQGHEGPIHKVSYHQGRFYTASKDTTIKCWDLLTMTCVQILKGHKGAVRDVKVADDRIVSCSDDGTTRIWDLHTSKAKAKPKAWP